VKRRGGELALFAVMIASAGCGGNGSPSPSPDAATPAELTDISGWYRVTSDLQGPCGMTKASVLAGTYAFVERNQNTFVWRVCSGPTRADCTGTIFYDFTKAIDHGLSAEGGTAFFSAGCTLTWERAEATLVGTELHGKSLENSIHKEIPQSACNLDAARMLTEPCVYEVDLVATRL
jgi:hypothetical protein